MPYNKKILSNKWDFIVDWSMNLGNHHFAITINNLIDASHKPIYYDDYPLSWYESEEKDIKECILKSFPTTTYIFIVGEKNKKGLLHFHCFVAIRNFIDYSYILKNNITLAFNQVYTCDLQMSDKDVKVEVLKNFKDIKNWIMYIYKDMSTWKFYSVIHVIEKYIQEPFLSKLADVTYFYLKINFKFECIENKDKFLDNIIGIRLVYNTINQKTLINLLQYYLILNQYFIWNDNIYIKIEDTRISYKLIGTITHVLYDMFQENVVTYYITNHYYYFNTFNFDILMSTYFIKAKNIVETIKDISTQRIQFDFSLIEFNDGVYSIKYDRFFNNGGNFFFDSKLGTIKYYNKSYAWVRQCKPINWINGLRNALNIKGNELNNENYNNICLYIINTIHKNIFNKKSTLFIYGKSNTGKTTLLTIPLYNFFGDNNIGLVVNSRNFKWQGLEGKILVILDEARYTSSMSSDFLKVMCGEKLAVEKKYSKNHINIDTIQVFILANMVFTDNDKETDKALKNRMCVIEFVNVLDNDNLSNTKDFKKNLKDEEVNIIIYCNKLLFNKHKRLLGTKIPNSKVLKLINKNN